MRICSNLIQKSALLWLLLGSLLLCQCATPSKLSIRNERAEEVRFLSTKPSGLAAELGMQTNFFHVKHVGEQIRVSPLQEYQYTVVDQHNFGLDLVLLQVLKTQSRSRTGITYSIGKRGQKNYQSFSYSLPESFKQWLKERHDRNFWLRRLSSTKAGTLTLYPEGHAKLEWENQQAILQADEK